MKISGDAVLQAAATIVAAQITAKTISTDPNNADVIASLMEAALKGVTEGGRKFSVSIIRGEQFFFGVKPPKKS